MPLECFTVVTRDTKAVKIAISKVVERFVISLKEAGGPNAEENLRRLLPQLSQKELNDAHRRAVVWKTPSAG
jgi:hypothetical protein